MDHIQIDYRRLSKAGFAQKLKRVHISKPPSPHLKHETQALHPKPNLKFTTPPIAPSRNPYSEEQPLKAASPKIINSHLPSLGAPSLRAPSPKPPSPKPPSPKPPSSKPPSIKAPSPKALSPEAPDLKAPSPKPPSSKPLVLRNPSPDSADPNGNSTEHPRLACSFADRKLASPRLVLRPSSPNIAKSDTESESSSSYQVPPARSGEPYPETEIPLALIRGLISPDTESSPSSPMRAPSLPSLVPRVPIEQTPSPATPPQGKALPLQSHRSVQILATTKPDQGLER